MPTTFIDQAGATPGTALDAAHLNGLVSGLTTANLDAAAGLVAGQIASVNGSALLKGVRQVVTYKPTGDITVDWSHQSVPSTTYANWGHLADVAITTVAGSSVLALAVGTPYNYHPSSGNWWRAALALDGAGVQATAGEITTASPNVAYNTPAVCLGVWAAVSAGAHNVNVLGSSGGGSGLNPAGGYKKPDGSSDSGLVVIVVEFA